MSPSRRWTKYRREFCLVVEELSKLGATKRLVASVLGVHEDTVRNWEIRYPEFAASLAAAKQRADLEVAKSLYKQATGYSFTTQESYVLRNRDGNQRVETVTLVKYVPPKTAAATFWLRNRQPEMWSGKLQQKAGGEIEEVLRAVTNKSRGLPSEQPTALNHRVS